MTQRDTHELSSREVYSSARLLKAQYGDEAADKAKRRIGRLLHENGSPLAIAAWAQILVALEADRNSC